MIVSIVDMKTQETGTVTDIQGGAAMTARIQSMGIRAGKKIKKTGSHFWRGPQTVTMDNLNIAIGHGMAARIFVEVER